MSFPSAQNLKNSLNDDEIISNIVKNMSLNTGNEITPIMAVTKNAQIVKGSLNIDIPFVRKLITVTI